MTRTTMKATLFLYCFFLSHYITCRSMESDSVPAMEENTRTRLSHYKDLFTVPSMPTKSTKKAHEVKVTKDSFPSSSNDFFETVQSHSTTANGTIHFKPKHQYHTHQHQTVLSIAVRDKPNFKMSSLITSRNISVHLPKHNHRHKRRIRHGNEREFEKKLFSLPKTNADAVHKHSQFKTIDTFHHCSTPDQKVKCENENLHTEFRRNNMAKKDFSSNESTNLTNAIAPSEDVILKRNGESGNSLVSFLDHGQIQITTKPILNIYIHNPKNIFVPNKFDSKTTTTLHQQSQQLVRLGLVTEPKLPAKLEQNKNFNWTLERSVFHPNQINFENHKHEQMKTEKSQKEEKGKLTSSTMLLLSHFWNNSAEKLDTEKLFAVELEISTKLNSHSHSTKSTIESSLELDTMNTNDTKGVYKIHSVFTTPANSKATTTSFPSINETVPNPTTTTDLTPAVHKTPAEEYENLAQPQTMSNHLTRSSFSVSSVEKAEIISLKSRTDVVGTSAANPNSHFNPFSKVAEKEHELGSIEHDAEFLNGNERLKIILNSDSVTDPTDMSNKLDMNENIEPDIDGNKSNHLDFNHLAEVVICCDNANKNGTEDDVNDKLSKEFYTTTEPHENDRYRLKVEFKRTHPVELWTSLGLYDDTYLDKVNSHWLKFEPAWPSVHKVLALLYCVIMLIGCGGNLLVIMMFIRCRSLRTPPTYLVLNLAISDFFMMAKMPIFIYNSFYEGPVLGALGCQIYGFIGGLTGCCSIMTLAAISFDRYYVIVYPLNPLKRTTSSRALFMLACVWTYSAMFASVPLLGINAYVSEGYLTSCSFDYLSDKMTDKIFVGVFFVAAYVFPLILIVFSYAKIYLVVRHADVEFFRCPGSAANLQRESFKCKRDQKKQKTEVKIALLSAVIILIWSLAWTPYAIVALLGIFGFKDVITPFISAVPALFCKTASCIDPWIYSINHPRFQRELRNKFTICTPRTQSQTATRGASIEELSFSSKSIEMTTSLRKKSNKSNNQPSSLAKRNSALGGRIMNVKHVSYSPKKPTSSTASSSSRSKEKSVKSSGRCGSSEENTSSSARRYTMSQLTPNICSSSTNSNSKDIESLNSFEEMTNFQSFYRICPTITATTKSKFNGLRSDNEAVQGENHYCYSRVAQTSFIEWKNKKENETLNEDVICETKSGAEQGTYPNVNRNLPKAELAEMPASEVDMCHSKEESLDDYVLLCNLESRGAVSPGGLQMQTGHQDEFDFVDIDADIEDSGHVTNLLVHDVVTMKSPKYNNSYKPEVGKDGMKVDFNGSAINENKSISSCSILV